MLETNLSRLLDIPRETNEVIRATHDAEGRSVLDELEHVWKRIEHVSEVTDQTKKLFQAFREYVARCVPSNPANFRLISLYEIAAEGLNDARAHAHHRNLGFYLEGDESLFAVMEPSILKEIIDGLLKNAIENTPDEGAIYVRIKSDGQKILLEVQDTGVGITEENRDQIFTGLFHTQETDLYGSGKPYNFNAGGKGLDLLLAKIYAQRFGFHVLLESVRCVHIPTDKDMCPGQISRCSHCLSTIDCFSAGGSTFTVSFPSVADPR
jgi:signal transduction histidine kinase